MIWSCESSVWLVARQQQFLMFLAAQITPNKSTLPFGPRIDELHDNMVGIATGKDARL